MNADLWELLIFPHLDFLQLLTLAETYPHLRTRIQTKLNQRYQITKKRHGLAMFELLLAIAKCTKTAANMTEALTKMSQSTAASELVYRLPDCTIGELETDKIGSDLYVPHRSITCGLGDQLTYTVGPYPEFKVPERALILSRSMCFLSHQEDRIVKATPYVIHNRLRKAIIYSQCRDAFDPAYFRYILPPNSIEC